MQSEEKSSSSRSELDKEPHGAKRPLPQEPASLANNELPSEKILVAADVCGQFHNLFQKFKKISSVHGKFDMILVVGDFFGSNADGWAQYKGGLKDAPVETFILGPLNFEQMKFYPTLDCKSFRVSLTDNINYIGKYGVFTSKHGLNVGYISGLESKVDTAWGFTEEDINQFIEMTTSKQKPLIPLDILMVTQWPANISKEHNIKNPSQLLEKVIAACVPRYVFCAHEGIWFKKDPYFNPPPFSLVETRFIALGKFNTSEKSLFALDLKRKYDTQYQSSTQDNPAMDFIRWQCAPQTEEEDERPQKRRQQSAHQNRSNNRQRNEPKVELDCWFCLSSPKLEEYYVVSLGKETYAARAKGGLDNDHLFISTVNHIKCFNMLSDDAKAEVDEFKRRTTSYYRSKNCVPFFFERCLQSTVHFQLEAVPLPPKVVPNLKEVFQKYADKFKLDIEWYPGESNFAYPMERSAYFLGDSPSSDFLFIRIIDRFPASFARMALADEKILNKPDMVNWKHCVKSVAEETDLTKIVAAEFANH